MVEPIHFTFEFNDIRDLFTAPEYDPFDEKSYEEAGLDIISNYLEAHPISTPASATIYLPSEQITPDLQERFREALRRFKERRILANKNEMRSNRNEGWRTLIYSIIIAVVGVLIVIAAYELVDMGWVVQLTSLAAVVVFWVVTWWPVETLFFNNLAPKRMNRVWVKVAEIPFEFKPSPAPEGSIGVTGAVFDGKYD